MFKHFDLLVSASGEVAESFFIFNESSFHLPFQFKVCALFFITHYFGICCGSLYGSGRGEEKVDSHFDPFLVGRESLFF